MSGLTIHLITCDGVDDGEVRFEEYASDGHDFCPEHSVINPQRGIPR